MVEHLPKPVTLARILVFLQRTFADKRSFG
jgi:hypothetical protein